MTKEITQVGAESRGGDGPSVFTEALVRGLTTGRADRNRDGRISIDELYDDTFTEVTAVNPNQTPTKFSDVSGELIVAYSPGPSVRRSCRTRCPRRSSILWPACAPRPSVRSDLALKGDDVGRLAYGRLKALLNDDSRMVTSTAEAAIVEIERARPFPRVDSAPFHGAMGHPQPVETWTPPTMPASVNSSPPPLPWQPSTPPRFL